MVDIIFDSLKKFVMADVIETESNQLDIKSVKIQILKYWHLDYGCAAVAHPRGGMGEKFPS